MAVVSRDVERLARMMQRQKVDAEYIRHYLMETYQLDIPTIDQLFEKLGIGTKGPRGGGHGSAPGGLANRAGSGKPGEAAIKKKSFY